MAQKEKNVEQSQNVSHPVREKDGKGKKWHRSHVCFCDLLQVQQA